MTIYFISGLGADQRALQKLKLPENWVIRHLPWPEVSDNETFESYIQKFLPMINIKEDCALVGVSFGGMIAGQLTKHIQPKTTIAISSIATKNELPFFFRLLGTLKIHKIIPAFFLNKIFPFTYWYFRMTSREEQRLLKEIIQDTPVDFSRWAIHEILN